jgi:hypothetical protein
MLTIFVTNQEAAAIKAISIDNNYDPVDDNWSFWKTF